MGAAVRCRAVGWSALGGVLVSIAGCGDRVIQSERQVTSVVISRDSASLEVGDTIVLRAEARDLNGDPIVDAAVTWATLDPNVSSLDVTGVSARVATLGSGTGRIVASTGDHADTAVLSVPSPLTATTLSQDEDTLEALGGQAVVDAISVCATGLRPGRYNPISRDPAVVQAAMDGTLLTLTAVAPGATYVAVLERHGTRDSIFVTVRQREATVELTPDPVGGFSGRGHQLTATVKDPRGNAILSAPVNFTSLDTSIVTVSPTGLVTFGQAGIAFVEARSPAGPADTTKVIVQPMPSLHVGDSVRVGIGLLSPSLSVLDDGYFVSPWVQIVIADTTIARAPDSVLLGSQGGAFRITGKRAGTTTLVATSPLLAPDTLAIRVTPSRIHLGDYEYSSAPYPLSLLVSLGSQRHFTIVVQDSFGTTLPPADSVAVSVVSSDTTVLTLPQSGTPYTIPQQGASAFLIVPMDTGSARVVATTSTPGFQPDSLFYVVIPNAKLRFLEGQLHVIGAGQRSVTYSAITTTRGWDHGDVLVTFTRRHTDVAIFPDTLTIPITAVGWPFGYVGLVPGADTIVASAPGYDPDTAIVVVTTPHFILSDTSYGTTLGGGTYIQVADSLGVPHATDNELVVIATVSDTTVARSSSTRIPAQWQISWGLPIPTVDTGTTSVNITDSAGLYLPRSFTLLVTLSNAIRLGVSTGEGPGAPRMRFDETQFWIEYPEALALGQVVHLAATNPEVLRLPDSVVIGDPQYLGYHQYFSVAAGDTEGTTRIIATTPGFEPDTSAPVTIASGRLRLYAPGSVFVGSPGYVAVVSAQNHNRSAVALDTAATFTLVPLDSGIGVDSSALLARGEIYSAQKPLTFTAPGNLRLAVQDRRPVPVPYRGDTVTIAVVRPRLILTAPPVVGIGQLSVAQLRRTGEDVAKEILVTIRHSGGRTTTVPTVKMELGTLLLPAAFAIEGRAGGPDTLFVSAPGYDGDSLQIQVTDGTVTLYNWPQQLRQGDSAGITLSVRDSLGVLNPTAVATTFSIVTEGGITFTDGARTIHTITVLPGYSSSPIFKVKAVGPAGPARVRFLNLNYTEQTYQLSVTP